MWLTTLSFQNSEAKPSANKVIAGPTLASLIEICLLQNTEGRVPGWLQSRTGKKFRERQKANTSQRMERGYEQTKGKRR